MLADVLATFRRWLYLPNPAPLYATLAAVAANRFEGHDPLWLALVGPPGCGKSEILQSLNGLKDVRPTADLTVPSLLSGTAKKERDPEAKGGILRDIGDFGIISCKDFGTILSMHPEERRRVMAALREIYDGAWHRDVGVDGHRRLAWTGKVGLLIGVTPIIDRHHGVMAAMGERLVFLRFPQVDDMELGRRAWAHVGAEALMRTEMRESVSTFFEQTPAVPEPTSPEQGEELVRLAALVVRCRSAVERDNYSREIDFIPEAEAPTRLVGQLDRLFGGLRAIGAHDDAWSITVQVALDSMPALRRKVIYALLEMPPHLMGQPEVTLAEIAEAIQHPRRTTERAVEDLAGHGIVRRYGHGQGKPATFELDPWVVETFSGLRAEDAVAA